MTSLGKRRRGAVKEVDVVDFPYGVKPMVYDLKYEAWYQGKVVDATDTHVMITYPGWYDDFDEWIAKASDRFDHCTGGRKKWKPFKGVKGAFYRLTPAWQPSGALREGFLSEASQHNSVTARSGPEATDSELPSVLGSDDDEDATSAEGICQIKHVPQSMQEELSVVLQSGDAIAQNGNDIGHPSLLASKIAAQVCYPHRNRISSSGADQPMPSNRVTGLPVSNSSVFPADNDKLQFSGQSENDMSSGSQDSCDQLNSLGDHAERHVRCVPGDDHAESPVKHGVVSSSCVVSQAQLSQLPEIIPHLAAHVSAEQALQEVPNSASLVDIKANNLVAGGIETAQAPLNVQGCSTCHDKQDVGVSGTEEPTMLTVDISASAAARTLVPQLHSIERMPSTIGTGGSDLQQASITGVCDVRESHGDGNVELGGMASLMHITKLMPMEGLDVDDLGEPEQRHREARIATVQPGRIPKAPRTKCQYNQLSRAARPSSKLGNLWDDSPASCGEASDCLIALATASLLAKGGGHQERTPKRRKQAQPTRIGSSPAVPIVGGLASIEYTLDMMRATGALEQQSLIQQLVAACAQQQEALAAAAAAQNVQVEGDGQTEVQARVGTEVLLQAATAEGARLLVHFNSSEVEAVLEEVTLQDPQKALDLRRQWQLSQLQVETRQPDYSIQERPSPRSTGHRMRIHHQDMRPQTGWFLGSEPVPEFLTWGERRTRSVSMYGSGFRSTNEESDTAARHNSEKLKKTQSQLKLLQKVMAEQQAQINHFQGQMKREESSRMKRTRELEAEIETLKHQLKGKDEAHNRMISKVVQVREDNKTNLQETERLRQDLVVANDNLAQLLEDSVSQLQQINSITSELRGVRVRLQRVEATCDSHPKNDGDGSASHLQLLLQQAESKNDTLQRRVDEMRKLFRTIKRSDPSLWKHLKKLGPVESMLSPKDLPAVADGNNRHARDGSSDEVDVSSAEGIARLQNEVKELQQVADKLQTFCNASDTSFQVVVPHKNGEECNVFRLSQQSFVELPRGTLVVAPTSIDLEVAEESTRATDVRRRVGSVRTGEASEPTTANTNTATASGPPSARVTANDRVHNDPGNAFPRLPQQEVGTICKTANRGPEECPPQHRHTAPAPVTRPADLLTSANPSTHKRAQEPNSAAAAPCTSLHQPTQQVQNIPFSQPVSTGCQPLQLPLTSQAMLHYVAQQQQNASHQPQHQQQQSPEQHVAVQVANQSAGPMVINGMPYPQVPGLPFGQHVPIFMQGPRGTMKPGSQGMMQMPPVMIPRGVNVNMPSGGVPVMMLAPGMPMQRVQPPQARN